MVQLRIVIGANNHILVGDASGASLIFIPGGDLWRIDKLKTVGVTLSIFNYCGCLNFLKLNSGYATNDV